MWHHRIDDAAYVFNVVGNGVLAVLPRHPARHDGLIRSRVEAIQSLHGDERPVQLELFQLREMLLRVLSIAVEADEQSLTRPTLHEIAAVPFRLDGMCFDHESFR